MAPFVVSGALSAPPDEAFMEPTWIYHPTEPAKIVELARDAAPPEGWSRSPAVILDPARATADALTVEATGGAFALRYDDVAALVTATAASMTSSPAAAVDPDALANALAEISRLQGIIDTGTAENARLVADIEAAEGELDAAATAITDLQAALTKAQADGGFAVSERDEANKALDALKAELAGVRADLDAATAPKPAEAPKPAAKGR